MQFMNGQEVAIAAQDGGSFNAYLAVPASGSGPGLVVIQEIFGINPVMRQIADDYAKAGYMAIAPDLFWRQEPNLQLSDKTEEDMAKAFQLYEKFDEDKGVEDLIATLNLLKIHPNCNGRVGSVGYCLGGKLAFLMATRSEAECNVSYYGIGIDNNLSEIVNITHPLMLHIAEQDQFVPHNVQLEIMSVMNSNPLVTIHSYPSVNHAFARRDGQTYDWRAAETANERTLAFLQNHLS